METHGERADQQCLRQADLMAAETPEKHGERIKQKRVRQAELKDVALPEERRENQFENDRIRRAQVRQVNRRVNLILEDFQYDSNYYYSCLLYTSRCV